MITYHSGDYPESLPGADIPMNGRNSSGIIQTPAKEIEALFEKVEAYTTTTFELAKLKAVEASAVVVTTLVSKLMVVIAASLCMLILSIGASIWLGEVLGSSYYGYFIVAALYLILSIALQQFLLPIIRKTLGESIIKQALQ